MSNLPTEKLRKIDEEECMSLDKQIATLITCTPLPEAEVIALCERVRILIMMIFVDTYVLQAKEVLVNDSNVAEVRAPVNVCGDIHG